VARDPRRRIGPVATTPAAFADRGRPDTSNHNPFFTESLKHTNKSSLMNHFASILLGEDDLGRGPNGRERADDPRELACLSLQLSSHARVFLPPPGPGITVPTMATREFRASEAVHITMNS
jgi:hypothetical protein